MGCRAIRIVVFQRFDGVCVWCGKTCKLEGKSGDPDLGTVDHLFPRNDYRRRWPAAGFRKLLSCFACNQSRADTPPEDFMLINIIGRQYATDYIRHRL